jgi:hypothetical protein
MYSPIASCFFWIVLKDPLATFISGIWCRLHWPYCTRKGVCLGLSQSAFSIHCVHQVNLKMSTLFGQKEGHMKRLYQSFLGRETVSLSSGVWIMTWRIEVAMSCCKRKSLEL